jgi:SAM-dependent methyltransferase
MDAWRAWREIYRCPADRAPLEDVVGGLRCTACATEYAASAGFPDFRGGDPATQAVEWAAVQTEFEKSEVHAGARTQARNDAATVGIYREIGPLSGDVLDVGGSYGLVRKFLPADSRLLVIDPWPGAPLKGLALSRQADYLAVAPFVAESFAFVCGYAERLPLAAGSFDHVHMRSMLDHAASPAEALAEAHRVLRPGGRLVVGLAVTGSPSGSPALAPGLRGIAARATLKYHLSGVRGLAGTLLRRTRARDFRDHHVWHPTLDELRDLVVGAGFEIAAERWQPAPFDHVVYLTAAVSADR